MSKITGITERSTGVKSEYFSSHSIYLAAGFPHSNSFRNLGLEKQNLRNHSEHLPHLLDGKAMLKTYLIEGEAKMAS